MSNGHWCKEYDENCPGCQPALADSSGRRLPDDSPEMVVVRAFWATVGLEDKRACHRVWCHNSRVEADLEVMYRVGGAMEAALRSRGSRGVG